MLLTFFSFLMRFVDISKLHSERCNCTTNDACNKVKCWQQAATAATAAAVHKANVTNNSNSSSTSSGCDSNASSSKENYFGTPLRRQQQPQPDEPWQHQSITPQQLQQMRYYQQMQQQQLQLLQQQLLQRRRLQQHLREQGVVVGERKRAAATTPRMSAAVATSPALTCNQQYLMQQRLQQQQQHNWAARNNNINYNNNNNIINNNNNALTDNDILNNNNNNEFELFDAVGYPKGYNKFRRGMTEFSTNNDINNKSHLSQPLQNSPRHFHSHHHQSKQSQQSHQYQTQTQTQTQPQQLHLNSPQHFANINKHFTNASKQTHNNKHNQQTLPLNSSANNCNNITTSVAGVNASSPTSAAHSPLHYKNPLNSPNNSPFAYAYYGDHQKSNATKSTAGTHTASATITATAQQHQLQQHLRSNNKLPLLTQTQYQQHLNDLLLQQQHLQKHQQQLLSANKDTDDELSEESLKQNVAIVLNNLDRYNNALRSIILNEQVNSNSSVFVDDILLVEESVATNNNFLLNYVGGGGGGGGSNTMAAPATPESDYNSNATTPGSRYNMVFDCNILQQHQQQQHLVGLATCGNGGNGGGGGGGVSNNVGGGVGGGVFIGNNIASNNLNYSIASSHDFTHDNSDYQWLLDCDYRDGCSSGLQRSIFSSLSGSYNGDIIFYNDFSKKLDANLAEVDMESFRAEDILLHMPSYCKNMSSNNRLQQSLLIQQQQHMLPLTAQHAHNLSQTSLTSNAELIDNSICKSELLFSPVKESHLSEDSLDMDAYPENEDIILTCKANKDNYTIAFEGSVLYSDESFYAEPSEIAAKNTQNFINLHSNLEDIVQPKAFDVSMSRSEQAVTARGKLQKSSTTQLQRYPSGNNNTATIPVPIQHAPYCMVRKSRSVPNLREQKDNTSACTDAEHQRQQLQQLNVSQAVSTSTVDCCKSRNLLPMCQMPISCNSINASMISERMTTQQLQHQLQQQQQQQQYLLQHQHQQQQRHKHRCCCAASSATNGHNCAASAASQQRHIPITGSASSGSSNPPAFNLVKLFIKQKSNNGSTEEQLSAHTCMDVSSGCWPSSDAAASSSSSSLEQRLRKKSMNDSGKGSALSRHDEEDMLRARVDCESDFQTESNAGHPTPRRHLRMRNDAVFYDEDPSSSSSGSLTATNSPAHRRRSMPLRHPQLCQLAIQHKDVGTACSLQSSEGSRSNSEQLTQVYVSTGTSSATLERKKTRCDDVNRTVSAASSSEVISRSMQTSCGSLSTRSSVSDRFRCVPPSFLAKLNNLGEERQAPIYVIYPNYALPDLGFVKTNSSADVIFSPFNYKMPVNGTSSNSISSLKKRFSLNSNDDEILKAMDYKHVVDWTSLTTLLPADYRRRLKHIPEVSKMLPDLDVELSQRPLFCMTPPIRRHRPHLCDCAQYFQQQQQQQQQQTQLPTGEEGSSSSASSQQPSSGYRGSSTLLADSTELENTDPLKQMYVYQYEQQRMDSGVEMSPAASKAPPQPMPRGILRKTSSQSATRTKRNSMIEEQQTKISKLEKRRSLQEPPYHHAVGSSEELGEVFEEETDLYAVPQPRKERLSRKDLDARMRAENFLSSLPRSELKHYAEIAAILESSTEYHVEYDSAALKKEVSRALSQQKKVSFNDVEEQAEQQLMQQQLLPPEARDRFCTPPNSPNISMATGGSARLQGNTNETVTRRCSQAELNAATERKRLSAMEEREKRKIESNRFKRLQIQWELMSKDSAMLKDLASDQHTKSGGSTPTAATNANANANASHKSRIPRPVSYPAGKISTQEVSGKTTRSPSRIVPPKRYSMTGTAGTGGTTTAMTTATAAIVSPTTAMVGPARARTPTSRTAVTAPNTPKRRVQSPRTIPRVR